VHERQAAAEATAAASATSRAAASVATRASTAGGGAGRVSGDAGAVSAAAARVSRELQTLLTYLTTTPSNQIDSGYIASQATYLTRQLTALENSGAAVGRSVTILEATLRRLTRSAAALH
jgi:hypothetical protein